MPVIASSQLYTVNVTAKQIIQDAMLDIRALGDGEQPTASELSHGLRKLNRMLDRWNAKELMIYARTREEFTLTVGTAEYTIGPSADFDTSRPTAIEQGEAFLNDGTIEFELNVIELAIWGAISQKDLTGTVGYLYYEQSAPLGTIHLYPTPDDTDTLILYKRVLFSQLSNAETLYSFPPGYAEALVSNLAIGLAPSYGKSVSAEVIESARSSVADIKSVNSRPRPLISDAPGPRKRTSYNILSNS